MISPKRVTEQYLLRLKLDCLAEEFHAMCVELEAGGKPEGPSEIIGGLEWERMKAIHEAEKN